MHMQGQPRTMQSNPHYDDLFADINEFFAERLAACEQAGIQLERIILDPGFGFGKTLAHNYEILNKFDVFNQFKLPVLAGLSRKSMIGNLLNRDTHERLAGSLAGALIAAQNGAKIIRVHDVQETVDVLAVGKHVIEEFQMSNTRKYFGTDGVRGMVGEFPITPEFALKLGWAAGRVLSKIGTKKVIIGKDTRISGYMLETSLEAGLIAAGIDVVLLGPMPTPAVAYLTQTFRAEAGIVISASHNPYHDNGIKFFSGRGLKLADEVELEIEAMMDEPMTCVASDKLGKARRLETADGRYIEFCKSQFPQGLSLEGLKIVLDCANGATYHIAPSVMRELGAEVICHACRQTG